jgi:hypothetical protein
MHARDGTLKQEQSPKETIRNFALFSFFYTLYILKFPGLCFISLFAPDIKIYSDAFGSCASFQDK